MVRDEGEEEGVFPLSIPLSWLTCNPYPYIQLYYTALAGLLS